MHSDSWADVPYEQCPPHIQHNIDVIGRMDAFHAADNLNRDSLLAYVESLYQGKPINKPRPVRVPTIDDAEMEYMMANDIKDASKVVAIMLGDDGKAIEYFVTDWCLELGHKQKYLAYNRKALEKRYKKGSGQEEIDRVKKLISDGETEIAFLVPRIKWAQDQLR